jgi:osmoprotectant transport system permease protein
MKTAVIAAVVGRRFSPPGWIAATTSALLLVVSAVPCCAAEIKIGSKRFTESYVLGEIATKLLRDQEFAVEHRQGMGGTIILWEALRSGAISAYPEYTGTISEEILQSKEPLSLERIAAELAQHGIGVTRELGFNNTYALVMRRDVAERLAIRRISDLREHPELRIALTHEFLGRQDGWQPLAARYELAMRDVRGVDHALGYAALANGSADIKDAYSTDAKIAEIDLVVLEDDANFFPQYQAIFLYRLELDPRAIASLKKLEHTLNESRMTELNARAERTKDYAQAAALYFRESHVANGTAHILSNIARWTARHLTLVGISLCIAIVLGIPLGIIASRPGALGHLILSAAGVVQTIPALALLALLVPVPFLGISPATAIVALFLYSLLPIIRNTATGLQDIPLPLRESAAALGLDAGAQLRKIYLPIASRTILAGIKTSAVINVGSATLAALIGAGGLGEPIISGLNLNDHATILQGAIPAALLALGVQLFFDGLDRVVIPRGLRLRSHDS